MGKPKIFVITLAGNNPVYFAGSNIDGNITLELSEPKKMQGISIVLSGLAYVHWTEQRTTGSGDNRRTETVHYSDSETILNPVSIQLWGNGKDSQELAAGRYEFPFKFQLPSNLVLPTSYESHTGYIRYALTSTISRSWKFNHTTKRAITVNEIVDINTPQLATQLSSSNEKTLCCLCCASGPISLSVTTDRGGYCSGESIAISTEAENHSNRRVTAVRASLKRIVVYYARGHSRAFTNVVQRIEGPGIEAGGTSNWSNELLPIPATVPCIGSCRILNLSYVLNVTLALPRAIDLHVTIPVTIGNVPFRGGESAASSYPPVGGPPAQSSYPPPAAGGAYLPPAENPYPPPGTAYPPPIVNYSAAYPPVYIGDDNYTMGEIQYAPVYGFVTDYRFAPPPSYSEAVVKVQGGEEVKESQS
ncbi:arrestin domain-containing protein 3-like [Dysidea avara]|uniref:arrestin domain-containing protein 3-like n=1 Tax=Dysidea avara TaxID=196820 RepID=UPI0033234845